MRVKFWPVDPGTKFSLKIIMYNLTYHDSWGIDVGLFALGSITCFFSVQIQGKNSY